MLHKTKILFTGQTSSEANANQKLCCNKCKREEGSPSRIYVEGEPVDRILRIELKEFETEDIHYSLPICDECLFIEAAGFKFIDSITKVLPINTCKGFSKENCILLPKG